MTTTTVPAYRLLNDVRWWQNRWLTIYAANGRTILGELESRDSGKSWTATSRVHGRPHIVVASNPHRAAAALLAAIAG